MNSELTLCSSFSIILSLISTMFATSIPDRIKLFDYTIYGFLDLVVWDFHSAGPISIEYNLSDHVLNSHDLLNSQRGLGAVLLQAIVQWWLQASC